MGAKTIEEIKSKITKFVGINRDTGYLTIDNQPYGAVEGKLLGFNSHIFDYKGTAQKKFDIYLSDDGLYQIQIGFYSWVNFRLLNQLVNIPNIKDGGLIEVSTNKDSEDNLSIFVKWNGVNLKHKYRYADLKFEGKSDAEKQTHRNKIIDKWYNHLMELKPYDPAINGNVVEDDEGVISDDDLPF